MSDPWRSVLGADQSSSAGQQGAQLRTHSDGLQAVSAGRTVVAPLMHLSMVECTGDDAADFLHNQLTSDIHHLNPGAAQFAGWCTAKGRMLASFVVMRSGPGRFGLIVADDLLEKVVKRLRMFLLRAKVQVADQKAKVLIAGIAGPGAPEAIAAAKLPVPEEAMQHREFDGGSVLRFADGRFWVLLQTEAAADVWHRLAASAVAVPDTVWRWLDVQAGLPWISAATSEEFVPQMLGFEKLGGVSFHKGCYPGQEVVARTQYLGKVKRHLYRGRGSVDARAGLALYGTQDASTPCGQIVEACAGPDGQSDVLAVVQETALPGEVRIGDAARGSELAQLTPVEF